MTFPDSLAGNHRLRNIMDQEDELSRVTRLLLEGSLEDVQTFVHFLREEAGEDLEKRRFGRRRQHLLHVVAEVGCVEGMELLIAKNAVDEAERNASDKLLSQYVAR